MKEEQIKRYSMLLLINSILLNNGSITQEEYMKMKEKLKKQYEK
jgi:predicted metal-binding transcription factor (methanogenesis marker protein 9)